MSRRSKDVKKKKKESKKEPQDLRAEVSGLKKRRRSQTRTPTPPPSTRKATLRDKDDLSKSKDVSKKKKVTKEDKQDGRAEVKAAELERRSEKVGVQTHTPTTPSSMTAPKHRDQGDLSLRHRAMARARRLRKRRRKR